MTKSQAAIREWIRAMRDTTGNLPPMPGIFPDMMAPVVRAGTDGERELVMARWGMPSPPKFVTGIDRGVTNIRNLGSPHWRAWIKPENRTTPAEMDQWMTAPAADALELQRPLPDDTLQIVMRG